MPAEFTFEIKEEIGKLSERKNGWSREVNLISWNGGEPKIDIRDWSADHEKMGKGITLTDEESEILAQLLIAYTQKDD
ncbi:MAG: hypothetical protein IJT60_06160 [Clostridia bacterium]|nr:hypothetical protein [Clostridia bacterium]